MGLSHKHPIGTNIGYERSVFSNFSDAMCPSC
ncbi:MAG: hypothetical protein ACI9X0_000377, partial [Kiritimatiellia bacterium]